MAMPGGNAAYMTLVARFPLRPIRDDDGLEQAGAIIDELIARDDLDPGEDDYLDVLSDLVERYESEAHPMPAATDAGVVRYLIEAHGLNQSQFAREIGAQPSAISEVLSGVRALSKANIRSICARFHVSPAAFPLVSRPASSVAPAAAGKRGRKRGRS